MSTYYYIEKGKDVPFKKIKELSHWDFDRNGVTIVECDGSSKTEQALFDGRNYLWCYANEDGNLVGFCRFGGNDVGYILSRIEEMFELVIIDEHEYMDKYPPTDEEE